MHLSLLTRGIKWETEKFFSSLSEQLLPHRGMFDGKLQDGGIQMRVCPIQLWDICFPETELDKVMTTLFPNGWKGMSKSREYYAMALRLGMGYEKLPEEWKKDQLVFTSVPIKHTEMIGIGIKHDDYFLAGTSKKISWEEFQKLPEDEKKLYWEGI